MLSLDAQVKTELWSRAVEAIQSYANQVHEMDVTAEPTPGVIRELLSPFDFSLPRDPLMVLDFVLDSLRRFHVHNCHPCYFGLFVPAPTTMGIVADALVAAFNPALGGWNISPIGVEIERHLVKAFGDQFGYEPSCADGSFTTGGSEANQTALLTALVRRFPDFRVGGICDTQTRLVLYTSSEGHASVGKAARLCGLGTDAVRQVAVDDQLRMDMKALSRRVDEDRAAGLEPFLIVATAGTTSAGSIDPLESLADYAANENLWFHVDAAWAGAALLVPELKAFLVGVERADSITFDFHKWLSIPMGAGVYLTRHPDILEQTFRVTGPYMPDSPGESGTADPYARSIQWSRRFAGPKVFLSLAVAGWGGYAESIRHQVTMGEYLRQRLTQQGWSIVNRTPLPVVCFVDNMSPYGRNSSYLNAITSSVLSSGRAWISTTTIGEEVSVLRACVTNHRTQTEDVEVLVEALEFARTQLRLSMTAEQPAATAG